MGIRRAGLEDTRRRIMNERSLGVTLARVGSPARIGPAARGAIDDALQEAANEMAKPRCDVLRAKLASLLPLIPQRPNFLFFALRPLSLQLIRPEPHLFNFREDRGNERSASFRYVWQGQPFHGQIKVSAEAIRNSRLGDFGLRLFTEKG